MEDRLCADGIFCADDDSLCDCVRDREVNGVEKPELMWQMFVHIGAVVEGNV